MAELKYQLVLQWKYSSTDDYDLLIRLENLIRDGLGEVGIVDGHDFGSGEMNIFVHTNEPELAFKKVVSLFSQAVLHGMKAGYRDFDEDDYKPVYPLR